jgi:hypothetical protein
MDERQPPARREEPPRFTAAPKRGASGQWGRWRIEVTEGEAGRHLDARTLRAGAAIAALLNGERIETLPDDEQPRPRFEALPRPRGWLIVRLERGGTAKEIARTDDEPLALRVASLLTAEAPVLDAPRRRSIMGLGMRRPPPRS